MLQLTSSFGGRRLSKRSEEVGRTGGGPSAVDDTRLFLALYFDCTFWSIFSHTNSYTNTSNQDHRKNFQVP